MIRLESARIIINTNYFVICFEKIFIKFEPTKPAPPVTMIKFFIIGIAWQRPISHALRQSTIGAKA